MSPNDLFFIVVEETFSKRGGKSLPSEVTIYSRCSYFRKNIFIKKVARQRIFPFMVTKQKRSVIVLILIEVWKILVIAGCRVARKKKKIIKNFQGKRARATDIIYFKYIHHHLEPRGIRKSCFDYLRTGRIIKVTNFRAR